MSDSVYTKEVVCPVCRNKIVVVKVKSKACIVSTRDSDFCVHYEGINPIMYDVWVCEHCGYAAQGEKFEKISSTYAKRVEERISPFWKKRQLNGERDVNSALQAFKLALYNLQMMEARPSDFARVCIRIAWLYRLCNSEKETEFLKHALRFYTEAFDREKFPIEKFDEYTCMYLIAELSRRVGEFDDAIMWFSKLINLPEARSKKALINSAREQYYLTKEEKESG